MKTLKTLLFSTLTLSLLWACDRQNEDLIDPRNPEDFPIVIVLADDGDADLEDNDEVGIDLELVPIWDPVSRSVDGIIIAPPVDVRVSFELSDPQGFTEWDQYITGGDAIYEVDDCTDSGDIDVDLDFEFDASTGRGSFTWPSGIEEIELVLELNDALFDDEVLNQDDRGFLFSITGVTGHEEVRANTDMEFEYIVLDDEAVFGDWELDHNDPEQFAAFLDLFGTLNEDFEGLTADMVDKIEISFGFEAMEVLVELLETEEDECEPGEFEALEIEVECEYDFSLSSLFGVLSGDLEFEGEAEIDDIVLEFALEGTYAIENDGDTLLLTLEGELDGEEIEEQTLTLTR